MKKLYTYVQHKGTDLCMDWVCEKGHENHEDRDFCYFVRCWKCGRTYHVAEEIKLTPAKNPEEYEYLEETLERSVKEKTEIEDY